MSDNNKISIFCRVVCSLLLFAAPAVNAIDLPIPTSGLVVHLDASQQSTLTLGTDNHVSEWRSLTSNSFKYTAVDGQTEAETPYWSESSHFGGIPGVTFGFAPGFAYTGDNADRPSSIHTYLTANMAVSNTTVIIVFQSLNYGSNQEQTPIFVRITGATGDRAIFHSSTSHGGIQATGYYGTNGYAWVNGGIVFDYANGIGKALDQASNKWYFSIPVAKGSANIFVLTSQIRNDAAYSPLFVSSLGHASAGNLFCAVVSEILIYDRVLTTVERNAVNAAMLTKWKGAASPVCWTGAAGDGKWSSGGNWSTGAVPGESDTVLISGATPTVDSNIRVADAKLMMMINGAAVDVAEGQRIDFAVPANSTREVVGAYVGSGTIGKCGNGVLRFTDSASFAPTLTLCADSGMVDLNGGAYAFAGVNGGGIVTNSAQSSAVLTLGASSDTDLEARLVGDINLVKANSGTLSVASPQGYSGSTELAGGTIKAVTNLVVNAIPGLVLHLDASRADTIEEDEDGYVSSWRSLVGDDFVFKPVHAWTTHAKYAPGGQYYGAPYYSKTGVGGGLPGVHFGLSKAGDYIYGALVCGNKSITNRTAIIVQQNYPDTEQCHVAYGNYHTSYNAPQRKRPLLDRYSTSNYGYCFCLWNYYTNSVYRNAETVWDVNKYIAGESQNAFFRFAEPAFSNQAFVVSVVVPDSKPWLYEYFKPAVGSGCIYHDGPLGGAEAMRFKGLVCELLVFDRELSDDVRRKIETHLMNKWIRPPKSPYHAGTKSFSNTLPAASQMVVSGSSSLSGFALGSGLTIRASGLSLPKLSVLGAVDVSGTDLVFEGMSGELQGEFIEASGGLYGEFRSVLPEGLDGHKIRYRQGSASLAVIRGVTVIIR